MFKTIINLRLMIAMAFAGIGLQSQAQQTSIKYLSGIDKDHTVKWDFFCSKGMNSGKWTIIPVPSNWELEGFGAYNYGHDKNPADESGMYRYHFKAEKTWTNKQIELVFEGVMTDAVVKLNGQSAGEIHQGSFYRFQYNITKLIKFGQDNLLEVTVHKRSADSSVNNAEREGDFWIFGGIYRPVYLKILPETFVQRVAIDARGNGALKMNVFAENLKSGDEVSAQVKTLKGTAFGPSFKTKVQTPADGITLSQNFKDAKLWNPESPDLYKIEVRIIRNNQIIHAFDQRFGFRTVEVRKEDGIYVNGKKILIKGVNRHSAWPTTGRTLSRKNHLQDIGLIKDMNMNAVRMSHYPPDAEFLDLCDSLGLFVLDELTGWHQHYDTPVGRKLVKELVTRDVNHPAIILWDNGNEGGWNTELDKDYDLYDPQKRVVIHPWHNFNHIDTKHYPEYSYIEKAAGKPTILLHTEMIHGLYDGGHGASLADNWKLIRQNPRHAGGFLWVLADEGVLRKDKKDSLDTDGNHGADGIVGPYREKEGSFYAIKEIWSPVQIEKPLFDQSFKGMLRVENTYIYTDLAACKFSWKLIRFPLAKGTGTAYSIISSGKTKFSLAPGKTGSIQLLLPGTWRNADALMFTATDPSGREIYTWTWPIKSPAAIVTQNLEPIKKAVASLSDVQDGKTYTVISKHIKYVFDVQTGYLKSVIKNDQPVSFGNGPLLAGVKQALHSFKHAKTKEGNVIIECAYTGDAEMKVKWTFSAGLPAKLDYTYSETSPANFYGITFNVDESKIRGMKWMGDGPFRTWKNRLEGVNVNVWEKKYNNTITGETFVYPEFKGYHANFYWAKVEAGTSSFTVYTDQSNLFLQMLKPDRPHTVYIPHVNPSFPEGNLGFLDAIAPIGNKFRSSSTMGPQSQLNNPKPGLVSGRLWFDFEN